MLRSRFALTLLAAGLLATPVLAMDGPPGGGFHHGDMELLHGVKLTDAQRTQVHQIMQSDESGMRLTGKQMMDIHEQMSKALLSGATLDQLSLMLKQEEALRTEVDTQHLATAIKVRALLTPDQITQAATLHAKMESLHAQEHALMGTHDGGPE